jgi:pimeloyl-ACP methyl ester carboxylesterase
LQLLGIFGWSSWHFLPYIQHETLVIAGDDDPLVPIANARMLAERIPNATLEIVEGAGHLFLWDDAENLGRRISSFLNPARTRRGPASAKASARPRRSACA